MMCLCKRVSHLWFAGTDLWLALQAKFYMGYKGMQWKFMGKAAFWSRLEINDLQMVMSVPASAVKPVP